MINTNYPNNSTYEGIPPSSDSKLENIIGAGIPIYLGQELSSVSQLQFPDKKITQRSTDPTEFFRQFGVDDIKGIFKNADVDDLYKIIDRHKRSDSTCFHDLFGMELGKVLRNLASIKNFLPKEELSPFLKRWRNLFLHGYLGLLRFPDEFTINPITSDTEIAFFLPQRYKKEIAKFNTELQEKAIEWMKKNPSEENKKIFAKDVKPLLQQWLKGANLLTKFLKTSHAKPLLCGTPVSECPGAHCDKLSSLEDFERAFESTSNFAEDLALAYTHAFPKHLSTKSIFGTISKEFSRLRYLRDQEELLQGILKLQKDLYEFSKSLHEKSASTSENIDQAAKTQKKNSMNQSVEYLLQDQLLSSLGYSWLEDFRNIVQHYILPFIDPSCRPDEAYLTRLVVNLTGILAFPEEAPVDSTSVDGELSQILLAHGVKNISKDAMESIVRLIEESKRPIPLLARLDTDLKILYSYFKKQSETLLNELTLFAQKRQSELKTLPLLDKTLWLAKILVFVHDIHVLLKKQENREGEIFPPEYLDFLALEEISEEASPETVSIPTPQPFGEDPEQILFRPITLSEEDTAPKILIVPSTEEKTGSSSAPQKQSVIGDSEEFPPSLKSIVLPPSSGKRIETASQPSSTNQRKKTSPPTAKDDLKEIAEELRSKRKRKDFERIFRKLGLTPVPGKGSHMLYLDREGNNVTCLPHDKRLDEGTAHGVFNQVTKNLVERKTDKVALESLGKKKKRK